MQTNGIRTAEVALECMFLHPAVELAFKESQIFLRLPDDSYIGCPWTWAWEPLFWSSLLIKQLEEKNLLQDL